MSLSTSSSRAFGPTPPTAGATRKTYLKIFLVASLGMAVCRSMVRLFAMANDVGADTLLERIGQARAALPQIVAEDKDLVMLFGTSMTDAGFSPRQFDRQLADMGSDVKSFNFGFGGVNPYFQDYLSRRIRDAFQEEDRQLELAMIEFNPFQTTISRFDGARPIIDSFVTLLASPEEIWEITQRDPTRGIRMFTIYYLRDAISAEMATHFFGGFLRPPRPRSSLPEDEEASERRQELGEILNARFEEDYPDYTGDDWYYPWQGAGTIPEERSESTREILEQYYETLRTQRRMENDKLNRISCCDIEELHFEEELVQAFIRIVENFQEFSNHVEVMMLPRNTEWIQYPPEAVERLSAVIERIEKATGVTIRDYQDLDVIDPTMFRDTTHLSRYSGDVAFTSFLAETYGPMLAGGG